MKHLRMFSWFAILLLLWSCSTQTPAPTEPPQLQEQVNYQETILKTIDAINQQLSSRTFRLGKPGAQQEVTLFLNEVHVLQTQSILDDIIVLSPSRWVPFDARRNADGDKLTYLIDESDGNTASGLSSSQTTKALKRGTERFAKWMKNQTRRARLVRRSDTGVDPDITDSICGYGYGDPFLADIVHAGWYPGSTFDCWFGPGAKNFILAVSFSYIFLDHSNNPTDIDGNGFLDRALNENYYNDYFGDPNGIASFPWEITEEEGALDVQTVGMHEFGHSLCIGHVKPPIGHSLMEAIYEGPFRRLDPYTRLNLAILYKPWPNT